MDIGLALPEDGSLNGIPRKIVGMLRKRFSAVKADSLERMALLAACLVAMSRRREARKLLDSVCWKLEYTGNEVVWGGAGDCILLLASLFNDEGSIKERDLLLEKIRTNDIMSDEYPKAYYLEEDLAEHALIMAQAQQESPKNRLEILTQELLRFVYYQQFWDDIKGDVHGSERDVVDRIIRECYSAIEKSIE
ncbi:hypothetical protein [Alcanivorax sp. 1008]|uniref:hypothetical protein n=1 Tax=Alcanivorax sp. 1008 TaxID=2816853 RepID=UPI001DC9A89F|nr:hypothetical protein [Alcanivorax sp. 1008]MCC1498309.1 hypothetical protein [Alcanivorax sp. 1008]